ncbi:MAG: lysophospholipid acyltransferase family protein [Desulfovibrionaceae bacterium]|nr:lysophospholipid acyltransferase family protein [Desulfovibrionaceae bacterium]
MKVPPSLIGIPLIALYRLWCSTLTFRESNRQALIGAQPAITCFWHDEIFPALLMKKELSYMALISSSRDGECVTPVVRSYNVRLARGSSNRGGAAALHEMITAIRDGGYSMCIPVDGPKGPRHKAKPGAIWLAAQTGRPIIPVRTFMSRAKVFSSWDRFQLPLPFSAMHTYYGDPWFPQADPNSPASLRRACRELEERLNAITPDTCHD